MRLLIRTVVGVLTLCTSVVVLALAASYAFNLATDGGSKPVTELWHGKFVTADGVLTAYREWGSEGTPIVLIGGFLEPSFVWERVGPLLARAGHRVYALDLDGFGYSKRRGPYDLAEWADQTASFMTALGIRRPIVVGHSLGAAVAVELARRGLPRRIVLVDGDALTSGGPPSFLRSLLARSPFITTALRLSRYWDWPAQMILETVYGPTHPKLDHAAVSAWTDPFTADGAEQAMATIVEHGIQGYPRAVLQALRTKATVVWGAEDGVDPVAAGRRTARDLHARFVVIPHQGHLTPLSDPAAVAAAIERS